MRSVDLTTAVPWEGPCPDTSDTEVKVSPSSSSVSLAVTSISVAVSSLMVTASFTATGASLTSVTVMVTAMVSSTVVSVPPAAFRLSVTFTVTEWLDLVSWSSAALVLIWPDPSTVKFAASVPVSE